MFEISLVTLWLLILYILLFRNFSRTEGGKKLGPLWHFSAAIAFAISISRLWIFLSRYNMNYFHRFDNEIDEIIKEKKKIIFLMQVGEENWPLYDVIDQLSEIKNPGMHSFLARIALHFLLIMLHERWLQFQTCEEKPWIYSKDDCGIFNLSYISFLGIQI